ncbi:PREDICTED: peroxidase 3-like [Erythranthe guttata]|uniref:peroxidase 3-like n=1 Tax=Erythranthe guttata TaxID=4155 RepID=UPI00064DC592|nr:PREDICTED: peroxidase 3-like [Erythranthe guttata]|eukprot:XP_012827923.1 PREDICTED: peroxidase 3-like [Erythranthe guttata]
MSKIFSTILLCFLALGFCECGGLTNNFYSTSCPNAEKIVKKIISKHVANDATLPAKLLRMHFHDCFVRGCDGSVLIDSTAKHKAEKEAVPNLSLGGFEVIEEIKTQLEKTCPGIVSCADVLALAARDSVSFKHLWKLIIQFNKPMWEVETGRRDGIVSRESDALNELPSPASDFKTLKQSFADKGLSVKDLVVLSGIPIFTHTHTGAHTIGVGKCIVFSNRLYNFTGKGDTDTSLNTTYAATLRSKCRSLSDQTTTVEMDPTSSLDFDNHYFTALKLRQGLFQSDAALLTNDVARGVVDQMLTSGKFYTQFGKSMKKMGAIGVLTGDEGKIRKKCNIV